MGLTVKFSGIKSPRVLKVCVSLDGVASVAPEYVSPAAICTPAKLSSIPDAGSSVSLMPGGEIKESLRIRSHHP